MACTIRIFGAAAALLAAVSLLSACDSPSTSARGSLTAKEMMTADVPLNPPLAPGGADSPSPETPSPLDPLRSPASTQSIDPNKAMKVAPYAEPKRFHEFSMQGAANIVSYYTYSTYYSFVERSTATMRKVFTTKCTKCKEMANWVDQFVSQNEKVETGIPKTEIIDVYTQEKKDFFCFWVVAKNEEPPILGLDQSGSMTGYDSASTSKSLYRVEYVNGTNQITGIFKVPARYE